MPESLPIHSAPKAAAGYYYQARIALACTLRHAYLDPAVDIAIEKYDDVSFEKNGTPTELLQTKHRLTKSGDLTDTSVDLWKTLGVWVDAVKNGYSRLGYTRFVLITTATAPNGSAASLLQAPDAGGRNLEEAEAKLEQAGTRSNNKHLAEAIDAFLSLTPNDKKALLETIEVIDGAQPVGDINQLIEKRILPMIGSREKVAVAREMLEGWWMSRICAALQCTLPGKVSIIEVEHKIDEIRESLGRDSLPFNMEREDPPQGKLSHFDEMRFVRQLQLIGIGADRLYFAKRDFYRASEQRSYWARKNLALDREVSEFDRTLIEEWEPHYAQMCGKLPEDCCEETLRNAGERIYSWVETEARFPIRKIPKRFLTVGSYHILADSLRVGWHRDFRTMCGDKVNGG